jgi:hypothetical protein
VGFSSAKKLDYIRLRCVIDVIHLAAHARPPVPVRPP